MRIDMRWILASTCSLGALIAATGCTSSPPDVGVVDQGDKGAAVEDPEDGPLGTIVQGLDLHRFISVSAGASHSIALKSDGTVWSWGKNAYGEVGDGTTVRVPCPKQVQGLANIKYVSAGYYSQFAVNTSGEIYAWGSNSSGILGDGGGANRLSPVKITNSSVASNVNRIVSSPAHTLALVGSSVWAWGNGSCGALGQRSTASSTTPVAVQYYTGFVYTQLYGVSDISANGLGGSNFSLAATGGTAYAWGDNWQGQLCNGIQGYGNYSTYAQPVQTASGVNLGGVTAVAAGWQHSMFLTSGGLVYTCGYNANGQLGQGGTGGANVLYAKQVVNLTGIVAISAADNTGFALKNDGSVWTWGWGDRGQLGNNTSGSSSSVGTPVRVFNVGGSSNGYLSVPTLIGQRLHHIAGGMNHMLALTPDALDSTKWNSAA